MRATRLPIFVVLLTLFLSPLAFAQVPTGVPQFSSLQNGPIDTVNLSTLNVHFEIPIRSTPGRGLPFSAVLNEENSHFYPKFTSGAWFWNSGGTPPPAPWFFGAWPVRTLVPSGIPTGNSVTVQVCDANPPYGGPIGTIGITNNVLTVTGTYNFTVGEIVQFQGLTRATFLNGKNVTVASVSSGQFTATFSHANYLSMSDNGTVALLTNLWRIAGYTDIHNTLHGSTAGLIDPYGCTGTTSSSSTSQDGYITTAAATGVNNLGHYTLTVSVTAPSGAVISSGAMQGNILNGSLTALNPSTATDTNGNQNSVTDTGSSLVYADSTGNNVLTAVTTLCGSGFACGATYSYTGPNSTTETVTVTTTTGTTAQTNFACPGINDVTSASGTVVITLPDGSSYQIGYDTAGRVSSVTLPTGGTISYNYNGPNGGISCQDGGSSGFTRTTPDGTWTYARSYSSVTGVWTTTVTDPQGNNTVYTFSGPSDLIWVQASGTTVIVQPQYEVQRQVYQKVNGNQVLMETLLTCYNGNFTNCATATVTSPITQIDRYTYLPSPTNPPSLSETKYNNSELLTEDKEFDFNAALPPGNNQVSDRVIQYGTYSSGNCTALGNNLLNRPCTDTTSNGSSTLSQTTNQYDAKGNVQSIGSLVSGSTFLTKTFSYYSTGLINVATDVNGATTTYTYGACNSSFPTNIALKVNASLTLNRSMAWDCTGETPTSTTDENNQQTTFSYVSPGGTADPFWRVLQENFPDGGQTSWTYNSPTSTTTTTKMNSSQNMVSTALLDGLGRVTESQLCEDGSTCSKIIRTDTAYDAYSRPLQVYNPTRCNPATTNCGGTENTWGFTTYAYDVLGRTTQVTDQDGSKITTSYSSNCVTVTDEALNSRQSCHDGLGRLTQVTEDPGSSPHLNYVTSYTYDALGNLTNVTQNGSHQRAYFYDGLSRLTSETNPESGTATFKYDSDTNCSSPNSFPGQLVSRTDARNIRTCYQYDALNRLAQKSYSDGTATAAFTYDVSSADGFNSAYQVGRLVKAATLGSFPTGTYYSYDSMGRVKILAQCAYINNCGTSAPSLWGITNTYDLAGNLASYTDGSGELFTQTFDSAGRPSQLTSNWVDSSHPSPLSTMDPSVGYYSNGAVRKMTSGNGITTAISLEARLQTCHTSFNTSGAYITDGCNDGPVSGAIQDYYYALGSWGTTNNGNVTVWNALGAQNFNRSYTYDSLNRLAGMQETNGIKESCKPISSPTTPYTITWTYDAWGNRTIQQPNNGTCSFSQAVNANNQFSAGSYDAAGDLLGDGVHAYAYDAEGRILNVDGGNTALYVYNAFGQRVAKGTSSANTYYIYGADGQVMAERDAHNNWIQTYFYFGGQPLGLYSGQNTDFLHRDHLGSTRLVTLSNASISDSMDYLPFGEQIAGASATTHKFTGDERDSETNLDHTDFRQYSSALGRWMTPDPAGLDTVHLTNPQSWNRYPYVINDPIDLLDPDGLDYFDCIWFTGGENCATTQTWSELFTLISGTRGAFYIGNETTGDIYATYGDTTNHVGYYYYFVDPNATNSSNPGGGATHGWFHYFFQFMRVDQNDKRPTCIGVFFRNAGSNFVGPVDMSVGTLTATGYVRYAPRNSVPKGRAGRGGKTVRQWLKSEEGTRAAEAAGVGFLTDAILAEIQALPAEYESASTGSCK
jgi:RHS repeat-associated protein